MSRSLSEAEVLPSSPEDIADSFHTSQLQDYYSHRCAIISTKVLRQNNNNFNILGQIYANSCGRVLIFQQNKAQTES